MKDVLSYTHLDQGVTAADEKVFMSFARMVPLARDPKTQLFAFDLGNREVKVKLDPPKDRTVSIGIGKDGRLVLVYPKHQNGSANSVHEICDNYIYIRLNATDNLETILHGSVESTVDPITHRSTRTLVVDKMPPDDMTKMYDAGCAIKQSDLGFMFPEHFISPSMAQRLMANLQVDSLDIKMRRSSKFLIAENQRRLMERT